VDVAENGAAAVKKLKNTNFDLILMDIQMPVMDGYEATAVIRDPGSNVLSHDVPVIAMTANAMQGDREKCLKAGMNDYISKPINTKELSEILAKNLKPKINSDEVNSVLNRPPDLKSTIAKPAIKAENEITAPNENMLQVEKALADMGGDMSLYKEIAGIYILQTPGLIDSFYKYLKDNDTKAAVRQVHSIKSSSRAIGAIKLGDIAAEMEALAAEEKIPAIEKAYAQLKNEYLMVKDALSEKKYI
jgi:CheY-like chemotaxis protein